MMIYLDNNATTLMPAEVCQELLNWCNRGNPSSGYASAVAARKMMDSFRNYLLDLCGCRGEYVVIFTSGASESNATILRGVVDSYEEVTGRVPHLVVSAVEHKSIIEAAHSMQKRHHARVTFVAPTPLGHIRPEDVAAAIEPDTCLVCVMHANNETGAINNIRAIGTIAHKNNIPFHCDTVQSFGKHPIQPLVENVDSFSISFHKLGGPPGIGALVVRRKFLEGYKLSPLIFGTQNGGLRGGTENLPGIGAAFAACRIAMQDRAAKNKRLGQLKSLLVTQLATKLPVRSYADYLKSPGNQSLQIVVISGTDGYLCNTIMLSVVKRPEPICNVKLKKALEQNGVVVSIGSACNTLSPKASHVVEAMGMDQFVRKGVLRISLGDDNTKDEILKFVEIFTAAVKMQTKK